MSGDFDGAVKYCEEMISKDKSPAWKIELGDLYYYGPEKYDKSKDLYAGVIKDYKQKDGSVYYRYGLTLEQTEDFLNAAKQYEIVATQFRKPPLDSFSLTGVERCFKKNYQDIVATINGYNITRLELDERIAKASPFGPKDEKAILDNIILERLLYINALKYDASGVEFYKLTLPGIKRNLLLEEVRLALVVAKAKPTEKETQAYYKKNKQFYKLNEEVRAKEIIVDSENLARFILDTLTKNPAAFDSMVQRYSVAPSKGSNGNMGLVYRGTKPKEVETPLFAAKPNVLIGVIPSENKYGIYIVNQHLPDRYREYKDVKTQIEASVNAENVKKIDDKLLKDLKAKAKVEIYKDSIVKNESLLVASCIVATFNGRNLTWTDVDRRNIEQPTFAKVDMGKPDDVIKSINIMADEMVKLEVALRNKYYLNESYFTSLQEQKRRLLEQALYNRIVIEGVKVDSAEIASFYNEHREDYKIWEAVECQEIVVRDMKLAETLRKQVLSDPALIDTLVKQYSIAPTKNRYGKTGSLRKGTKPKAYENVAYKLKVGDVSRVFAFDDTSYAFIKLVSHTPPGYRSYEEVRPYIETNLRREKQTKIANDFLAKIRAEADIKIFLPEPPPVNPEPVTPVTPEPLPVNPEPAPHKN
jgi:parvulin-like peptidyl-prolyl isomerase